MYVLYHKPFIIYMYIQINAFKYIFCSSVHILNPIPILCTYSTAGLPTVQLNAQQVGHKGCFYSMICT